MGQRMTEFLVKCFCWGKETANQEKDRMEADAKVAVIIAQMSWQAWPGRIRSHYIYHLN